MPDDLSDWAAHAKSYDRAMTVSLAVQTKAVDLWWPTRLPWGCDNPRPLVLIPEVALELWRRYKTSA